MGTMRGAHKSPPSKGAHGEDIYSDAHICFSENVNCGTSEENVQGRTRESESSAHESDDTHYLLRDLPKTNERRKKEKKEKTQENVEGRTPGDDSAAQEDVNTHYLLRVLSTAGESNRKGKFKRRGKKWHSNKAATVNALSVDEALRMLEGDLNRLGKSAPKSKPQKPARRSARLARSQKRTGRWRNDVRQRKEVEEASRRE